MLKPFAIVAAALVVCGCAVVRQSDLDAWVGMPVEALDTHSLFITMPMYRTFSESGIEIRNYSNGAAVANCLGNGVATVNKLNNTVSSTQFSTCSSQRVTCNNLFYIREGRVLEYAPTGQCYTNDSVRPQRRYLELAKPRGQ